LCVKVLGVFVASDSRDDFRAAPVPWLQILGWLLCMIATAGLFGLPALASQTGLDAIGGIGSLIGSFFEKGQTYVGPTQVDLFRIRSPRARIQLHGFYGFSVQAVTGEGWLLGKPRESEGDIIQEVWFVRDPHRFGVWAKTSRIPSRPTAAIARLRAYGPSSDTNLLEHAPPPR
jgi:hypothetical protein